MTSKALIVQSKGVTISGAVAYLPLRGKQERSTTCRALAATWYFINGQSQIKLFQSICYRIWGPLIDAEPLSFTHSDALFEAAESAALAIEDKAYADAQRNCSNDSNNDNDMHRGQRVRSATFGQRRCRGDYGGEEACRRRR